MVTACDKVLLKVFSAVDALSSSLCLCLEALKGAAEDVSSGEESRRRFAALLPVSIWLSSVIIQLDVDIVFGIGGASEVVGGSV